ncbi:MAG: tetratricopeptide repeat protein [Bacteroidales bacterium]|nr:tetratricopeptide repeat protein [Bacteroidales bacterium]
MRLTILLIFLIFFNTCPGFSSSSFTNKTDSIKSLLKNADPDEMAALYNFLAEQNIENNARKSLNLTDSALYLARLHQQKTEIAKALNIKGHAYYILGKTDSSYLLLEESVRIYEETGDPASISSILNYLGVISGNLNDYQSSVNYHSRCLAVERQLNDSTGIISQITNIAITYNQWEKYDTALVYFNQALRLAVQMGDKIRIARTLNSLGNIYHLWSNYQESLDYYLESLHIYEEINDTVGISVALNNIGVIYHDWAEYDKSLVYFIQSYMVDSLMKNKIGQSQTLNNIAIIYDELGEEDKALSYYQQSLELAIEVDDKYEIGIVNSNLGEYSLEHGDFIGAEKFYFKAIDNYRAASSTIGVAETYILLGNLYKEKGDLTEALSYYKKGLDIVFPLNMTSVITDAYSGMAAVYLANKNFKEAILYTNKYHRINDSVFNIKTVNQLALLQKGYEIRKKEQEMDLQQARLKEQKSKIRRQEVIVIALSGSISIILLFTLLLIRQYRLRMRAWRQLVAQHKEILKNRQELIIAKEKAEESGRLKSSFLVNLSHELRTPMNGIMGFTDLLQKGTASEEQRQVYLSYIASSSRQLLKVLNDIIDISSIETRQMELSSEACDLHKICTELHEFFTRELNETEKDFIKLFYEPPEDGINIKFLSDRKRLSQIIFNLIENAIVFTEEGEVDFGYQLIDDKIIKIYVRDTGIGIERSKFEMIFDRFRQVDDTTTRPHGGSGLGLALCKELLGMMNGKIYLESEMGKGSTFYVEIPYIPAE